MPSKNNTAKQHKESIQRSAPVTISDCTFYGVKWDENALASLHNVTKALLNITEIFKGTNVNVTNVKVDSGNVEM